MDMTIFCTPGAYSWVRKIGIETIIPIGGKH